VIERWSISTGGYASYMQADEPVEAARAGFGATVLERLHALKQRYDPANVLHRSQNIPPSRPQACRECRQRRSADRDPYHRFDRERRRGSRARARAPRAAGARWFDPDRIRGPGPEPAFRGPPTMTHERR
jgi:hypothetical protein